MSDLTIVKSEPLPGPPPQASTGGELSVVKSEPVSKSFLDQVADYPKGIWENLVQTGQGMVNLATTDPRETIKGIGAAQDALRVKALDAFKKGDYVTAGRHALEYLIPMAGPQLSEQGDLAQRGEVGRALGGATSLGLQMALPGALHANAPAIVSGAEQAPAAIKSAAQTAGAVTKGAIKGGVKGGLEPVGIGRFRVPVPASMAGGYIGGQVGSRIGMPELGTAAGAAYPVVQGAVKGGRAALADRVAAGLEAQRAARVAAAAKVTPEAPVGLLGAGRTITPEAPPDTSYVRSVPAEYPQPEAVPPKALLGPGPERIITPPAPEDTSYVRSVPAEYPQGEGAPPAAPAAAAPAAPDPALLEGLAQANFKKPFAKLAAADQQAIRDTAVGFGRKIPEETRGPLPKFREGSESLGEPQPATQGKTIEQIVQEELAAGKQAATPVSEQPAGRPVAESNPVQEPRGLTEEAESVPNLEPPRSEFLASGERKSPLLRGAEITAANTTAKAQRFAQAMHGYVSSNEVKLIPKSRWNAITNDLIIRGLLKPEEVPPNTSIPQIADFLRGIETSANKAKLAPAAPVKPGVSAPAPESTQPPAAPSGASQTPSMPGAQFTGERLVPYNDLWKTPLRQAAGEPQPAIPIKEQVFHPQEYAAGEAYRRLATEHMIAVRDALEAGKPVPPEVLADYPSLGKASQSGRPAIESKPVQPSPGLTGKAVLQAALEKNKSVQPSAGEVASTQQRGIPEAAPGEPLRSAQQRAAATTAAKKAKLTGKPATEPGTVEPNGPILGEYRGDPEGAIKALRSTQSGEAIGALHHPELGNIDLVWGKAGDPATDFEGGFGLAHIEAKHPGVVDRLPEIISKASVKSKTANRAVLETADHKAVVRMTWDKQAKQWLLTAYEKK